MKVHIIDLEAAFCKRFIAIRTIEPVTVCSSVKMKGMVPKHIICCNIAHQNRTRQLVKI